MAETTTIVLWLRIIYKQRASAKNYLFLRRESDFCFRFRMLQYSKERTDGSELSENSKCLILAKIYFVYSTQRTCETKLFFGFLKERMKIIWNIRWQRCTENHRTPWNWIFLHTIPIKLKFENISVSAWFLFLKTPLNLFEAVELLALKFTVQF